MSMHRNLDLPRPHVVVAAHPSKNGYETRRAACGRYGQDVLRAPALTPEILCGTCLRLLGRAVERLAGAR